MSPRLLFLLSPHHALARRDEIDAELAAARVRRPNFNGKGLA